jgi:hypothetical protein
METYAVAVHAAAAATFVPGVVVPVVPRTTLSVAPSTAPVTGATGRTVTPADACRDASEDDTVVLSTVPAAGAFVAAMTGAAPAHAARMDRTPNTARRFTMALPFSIVVRPPILARLVWLFKH